MSQKRSENARLGICWCNRSGRPSKEHIGTEGHGQNITIGVGNCSGGGYCNGFLQKNRSTGEIMVTNDGATILKSIALDNAAAKVLVNISKVQDDEVGDGTTSVTVLAAELLREAEKLVDKKIHPQTIIEGYRIASHAALLALEKSAVDHSRDKSASGKIFSIARTTLSSKVLSQDRNHFAELACNAVLRMQGSTDLSHIQIIKKAGGKLNDSYLDEGFIWTRA
jgi:T-complex protein 1 subunit beta